MPFLSASMCTRERTGLKPTEALRWPQKDPWTGARACWVRGIGLPSWTDGLEARLGLVDRVNSLLSWTSTMKGYV